MQLVIEKSAYYDVEKISILKSKTSRVIKNEENNKKGLIEINLSYLNTNSEECFKTFNIDYEIDLELYEIIDIKIISTNIYVIENNGVNIDYKLEIDYDKFIEPILEVVEEPVKVETIVIEKLADTTLEEIEKIKEDISKDYENKLIDTLNRTDNKQVKIITTKDDRSELEFINFFNFQERGYHLIKTLYCPNDDVLNEIAKKYKIDFNDLLRGYDKANKKVTFRINE